jgi:LuxR family transcriptional regulator, maltose regulon positive regulatory protein
VNADSGIAAPPAMIDPGQGMDDGSNGQSREQPWVPRQRRGTMPIPPRHFVPRVRLWERLDESTRSGVTLVTGPLGSGKTLAIAGWLRDRGQDRENAIWVHADGGLTPRRLRAVLDQASNAIAAREGTRKIPRLVVIDDAHELPSASLRLIDRVLQDAPMSVRLVLASRWDVPLTRLVPELLGDLTVLRGDLLRMTDVEASTLVAAHMRNPDPDAVQGVVEWAHGWCAVLVLAAHAVGPSPEPAAAVRQLARGAAPVADQVASEVFATLTVPQRHLLLCLAGEEPFTARLAAHLSNDGNAADVLAELEITGLLVTRVPAATDPVASGPLGEEFGSADDTRFVIHPLLAEVVRRRRAVDSVDVARARATVTRAVRLDLARGHAPTALARLTRLSANDEAAAVLARDGVHMVLGAGGGDGIAQVMHNQPEIVEAHPSTWFAVALHRWLADDADGIRHWTDRIVARASDQQIDKAVAPSPDRLGPAQVACARLWRAKLGLEPLDAAVKRAKDVAASMQEQLEQSHPDAAAFPVLVMELGAAQGWIGEFEDAASSFATAMSLSRSQGLSALATAAMSHLAMTEYMAGHDRAAGEVATEAFSLLGDHGASGLRFAASRAGLALFLSMTAALPWTCAPASPPFGETGRHIHGSDLSARFWSRMREALLAAWSGSVASAVGILETPVADPRLRDDALPHHLRVVVLIGKALLAALSADPATLRSVQSHLVSLDAVGEERFVAGLRADCQGDRAEALEAFGEAADTATCVQPPVRAMSLACAAQLLDSLGEDEAALNRLAEATAMTEVRRNGVPFLGWSRQGSPMEWLLRRLDSGGDSAWTHQLAEAATGHSDVISSLESSTPLRREQRKPADPLVGPPLSPREREVLGELARGATYADIGATLFVSANTVKTHVSSLYTKLGASRRSDALAIARSHHIL